MIFEGVSDASQPAAYSLPFGVRLLVTLLVPIACVIGADWFLLPGVSRGYAESLGVESALSVFSLQVYPVISGYVVVELVAFFVPRWSSLRHTPEGRARIGRFVAPTVIAFASLQAFGIGLYLEALSGDASVVPGAVDISRSLVTLCLVGGVCVQWLIANWITRQGVFNGLVAISTVGMLREFYRETSEAFGLHLPGIGRHLAPTPHDLDLRGLVLWLAARVLAIAAGWIVLRAWSSTTDGDRTGIGAPRPVPTRLLVVCVLLAAALLGASRIPLVRPASGAPGVAGVTLEVVGVEDDLDPLRDHAPDDDTISIQMESVSLGPGQKGERLYAATSVGPEETRETAVARLQARLTDVPLPDYAHFGFETVTRDADMEPTMEIRSYVLARESGLDQSHVVDAEVLDMETERGPELLLRITLSPDGAQRFQEFTRLWIKRRIAFVFDGEVLSVPIVQSEIDSNQLTLPVGDGDLPTKLARARRWQAGLKRVRE